MEENQLKSLTCKNLIGPSSNRATTFHILPFLGISCPSSLSLSLLSSLPLRSVYSPGKIHRSDRDCSIFPENSVHSTA
ncbi:hypothetical protein AB3S75_034787 [Citrus x aurantiifolia]